ncbi:MAG TPA: hypothetical protein VMT77_12085 [Gemmatimonadales bacterium]|nr:hypothetical protein [Gemmatimonadales bacterium]
MPKMRGAGKAPAPVHLRDAYFFFLDFFAVFLAAFFFFIAIQPPRNGETLRRPDVAGGQTPWTLL